MNSIIQQITDWLKGILVSGIMDNLTNTFSSVNDQVGQIATEVGKTPSNFMPAVFSMVRNLSESVIMPVAGILLTFIACYELIQLIISYNNLASFETWFIWKWNFKTFVAVELITHTFDITMAVFDVSQSVVRQAGDIKAVQGDSGHAQADMVTEVYGHILDEDRRKNAELMENAFYNKENLNPQMKAQDEGNSTITVPDGVDAELLMKVLGNPEMAALLTSLAKTMKV